MICIAYSSIETIWWGGGGGVYQALFKESVIEKQCLFCFPLSHLKPISLLFKTFRSGINACMYAQNADKHWDRKCCYTIWLY